MCTNLIFNLGRLAMIALCLLWCIRPIFAQRQNLVEVGDFETGDLSQWRGLEPCGDRLSSSDCENSITIVTNPVRAGNYAAKFDLDKSHERSEVRAKLAPLNEVVWYGWSLYIPPGSDIANYFGMVSQFHRYNKKPDWMKGKPPVLRISNNKWSFRLTIKKPGVNELLAINKDLGPATGDVGKWTDWVVQVKWTDQQDGFFKIWKNGEREPMWSYEGPTYVPLPEGPYFKMGIYKGDPNWSGQEPVIIYGDEYRMGNANATYEDVAPGGDAVTPNPTFEVGKLLYSDDFNNGIGNWVSEFDNTASSLATQNSKLDMDVTGGGTTWFVPKLSGNVQIEYDAVSLSHSSNGPNINQFWMATDPDNPDLFTRSGTFSEYDDLELYYAGLGGNNNSTSRFRKYLGDGTKPVLQEYTDAAHIPVANQTYRIKIIVYEGITQFFVDDELYFSLDDANPYTEGNFGFRTFNSHLQYDNFRVYRLVPEDSTTSDNTQFSPVAYYGDADNYTPLTPSRWTVVADQGDSSYFLNTSDYNALSGDRLGEYSVVNDSSYSDFRLTLQAKSAEDLTANAWADYTVLFGYVDADNYSYLRLSSNSAGSDLGIVVDGVRSTLSSTANATITDTDYHAVEVVREGSTVSAFYDGTQLLTVTDAALATAGGIGVGSYNDAAYFDDIVIELISPAGSDCTSPVNLALNQPVSVSGEESGNPGSNAVDGIDDTDANRWSVQNYPQSLEVDLGSVSLISSTELVPYNSRGFRYRIEGKTTASGSYSTLVDQTGYSGGNYTSDVQSFGEAEARYVKVTITGCSGSNCSAQNWVSLREFKVNGCAGSVDEEYIYLEAENATLTSPLVIGNDANASGNGYIWYPSGNRNDTPTARASYSFTVNNGGEYHVWGRVITGSTGADSYWIRVDGGSWINWNAIAGSSAADWQWDEVHAWDGTSGAQAPLVFSLAAGTHTLEISEREQQVKLDRLLVTDDLAFVPSGLGGSANARTAVSEKKAGMELVTAEGEASAIVVYPNPCSQRFKLHYDTKIWTGGEVRVTDMLGREIVRQRLSSRAAGVDLSSQQAGIYLITVSKGERQWIGRIVNQ